VGADPRTEHEDADFDTAVAAPVDRCGTESVRTVIHRVLVDDEPFRTATNGLRCAMSTAFGSGPLPAGFSRS
jgi:hypothetical protein